MKKKPNLALLGILWLVSIALFVAAIVLYHDTRLSHRSGGFPYMPLYGAITWWFFLTIPLIGWTWGTLNDLKNDGMHLDQSLRHPDGEE
ncbi:MAG TPA: hypothetical protein VFS05_03205 [Gemmatimonadaceae bacterium]|nr:hypothetical protein [Gemmatimonadaceae bacterium]